MATRVLRPPDPTASGEFKMQTACRLLQDSLSPAEAFRRLRPLKPRFLLESMPDASSRSRHSFIGFCDHEPFVIDRSCSRPGAGGRAATILNMLADKTADAARLGADDLRADARGGAFDGGLVGYATYELARALAGLDIADGSKPLARYFTTTSLLVFDHQQATMAHLSRDPQCRLHREIEAALRYPSAEHRRLGALGAFAASRSETDFLQNVATAQEYIKAGDIYQLVLSIRHTAPCDLDPFDAYRALRIVNPSPYMYFLDFGDLSIAGSSPETLVSLKEGVARLRPIAGTRPRGETKDQDDAQAADLLRDPKERAEHVMLVDLARNDLGRHAVPGSVRVDPFMSIEKYSHVMHIVSGVDAALDAKSTAFDLFASAFPAGTLTGAPKRRAMELIAEMEGTERGVYGGAVGYFAADGSMDHAIGIRTLTFENGTCSFQAGAGIVADSDPAAEYQEIFSKSGAMRRALALAEAGL